MLRQIILDTETTGLDPASGHRIIEIGCVELLDRQVSHRNFHAYLNPEREIEAEAMAVHGITNEFLQDKPLFAAIAPELIGYLDGAELIIHNAAFDVGFLNHELAKAVPDWGKIETHCKITDTLAMARQMYPGQRNSLDALCKRLEIDNSQRTLHGALLDARILADVYLALTGGQVSLLLEDARNAQRGAGGHTLLAPELAAQLCVVVADEAELAAHTNVLAAIQKASGGKCVWSA